MKASYYPFGLKHKGYNNVTTSNGNSVAQKFKYNGIEFEESLGLNLYEITFRSYDPAIGRFNGIDPVTHYSQGTSVAFDNNPIFWADPSGADSETQTDAFGNATHDARGNYISAINRGGKNDDKEEDVYGIAMNLFKNTEKGGVSSYNSSTGKLVSWSKSTTEKYKSIIHKYVNAMNEIWRTKAHKAAVIESGDKEMIDETPYDSDISVDITSINKEMRKFHSKYGILSGDFMATFELDNNMNFIPSSYEGYKKLSGSVQLTLSNNMPDILKLRYPSYGAQQRERRNKWDFHTNSSSVNKHPWAIHYIGGSMSFKSKEGRARYWNYWGNTVKNEYLKLMKK